VYLRGAVEGRSQRQPNGNLRMRIGDINFSNMSGAEGRAWFAQQSYKQLGFERVESCGAGVDGGRVRTGFHREKNVVQGSDSVGSVGARTYGDHAHAG